MAGTIFISADIVFSAGSHMIDEIISRTQQELTDVYLSTFGEAIFEGYETAQWVNLDGLGAEPYRDFVEACVRALGKCDGNTMPQWEEFIKLLTADSRMMN